MGVSLDNMPSGFVTKYIESIRIIGRVMFLRYLNLFLINLIFLYPN